MRVSMRFLEVTWLECGKTMHKFCFQVHSWANSSCQLLFYCSKNCPLFLFYKCCINLWYSERDHNFVPNYRSGQGHAKDLDGLQYAVLDRQCRDWLKIMLYFVLWEHICTPIVLKSEINSLSHKIMSEIWQEATFWEILLTTVIWNNYFTIKSTWCWRYCYKVLSNACSGMDIRLLLK